MGQQVLSAYLSDMSDEELMVRPVPEANHAAWQLGHLVSSEHKMLADAGYDMPGLPDGFVEAYTPETSKSDNRGGFHKKQDYVDLMAQQRAATLAALEATNDADLDKPSPEPMRDYAPTIGVVFNLIGIHLMMHAAQFVPVRRKLGKAVLF
jgi:hypothetical protein